MRALCDCPATGGLFKQKVIKCQNCTVLCTGGGRYVIMFVSFGRVLCRINSDLNCSDMNNLILHFLISRFFLIIATYGNAALQWQYTNRDQPQYFLSFETRQEGQSSKFCPSAFQTVQTPQVQIYAWFVALIINNH
jgi:hypothetical protein